MIDLYLFFIFPGDEIIDAKFIDGLIPHANSFKLFSL